LTRLGMTMIIHQNTTSSGSSARYMLAQHMANPLRKEPQNVGVVVEKDGHLHAKFIGEPEPGKWESSRLRRFAKPNVYRLWVDRWRDLISKNQDDWTDVLLTSHSSHFAVIAGGELSNTGDDTPQELCNYLYGLLVSSGGLQEAIGSLQEAKGESEPEGQSALLRNDIASNFRGRDIMTAHSVRYPVLADQDVKGTSKTWHRVAFYQKAEQDAWAMEPVDFTVTRPKLARDHAAYARYMFNDLHERSRTNGVNINTVALVRCHSSDKRSDDVKRGIEILDGCCSVVNWSDPSAMKRFIDERVDVANRP